MNYIASTVEIASLLLPEYGPLNFELKITHFVGRERSSSPKKSTQLIEIYCMVYLPH